MAFAFPTPDIRLLKLLHVENNNGEVLFPR